MANLALFTCILVAREPGYGPLPIAAVLTVDGGAELTLNCLFLHILIATWTLRTCVLATDIQLLRGSVLSIHILMGAQILEGENSRSSSRTVSFALWDISIKNGTIYEETSEAESFCASSISIFLLNSKHNHRFTLIFGIELGSIGERGDSLHSINNNNTITISILIVISSCSIHES